MFFAPLLALASVASGAVVSSLSPRAGVQITHDALALQSVNHDLCIGVEGEIYPDSSIDGLPVSVFNCRQPRCTEPGCQYDLFKNETLPLIPIGQGDIKLQVNNTNFCLDAGATPSNGVQLKLWTCYDDLPAQAFYLTADQHVANTNTGLCLDIKDVQFSDNTPLQLWDCSGTATNQLFSTVEISSLPAAHDDFYPDGF